MLEVDVQRVELNRLEGEKKAEHKSRGSQHEEFDYAESWCSCYPKSWASSVKTWRHYGGSMASHGPWAITNYTANRYSLFYALFFKAMMLLHCQHTSESIVETISPCIGVVSCFLHSFSFSGPLSFWAVLFLLIIFLNYIVVSDNP